MNGILKKIFIFMTIIFVTFLYSYNIESNKLVVREKKLEIANWNTSLNGLRVAVVGDLHIGTKRVPLAKVKQVVKIINEQNPDLILILGDFDSKAIVYSGIPFSQITETLSQLDAPLGVFAVLGNHDYDPANIVQPILKGAGIKLLENESVYVVSHSTKIRICGISDIWHFKVDAKKVLGKIKEPTLFLSHNPDIFPQVPGDVSLTVSGHTHGGEVTLPLLGAPFIPSAYGRKYAKGYVVEDSKHLFVTSGVASLSRLRLFNPPEIVVLSLHSHQ